MSASQSPSQQAHLELAAANFVSFQDVRIDARWRVSMLFYSALHQVCAVQCRKGTRIARHTDRADWLFMQSKKIGTRYEELRTASEIARYQPGPFQYSPEQVAIGGHLFRKLYQPIATWAATQGSFRAVLPDPEALSPPAS